MKIAKIVSSNSHVDYVARVIDKLDATESPNINDYGFGSFVSIEIDQNSRAVGVVYNSLLINPDYANYGPRLSGIEEMEVFSPDFINEQGSLLGILLLGSFDFGKKRQGVPKQILSPGNYVEILDEDDFKKFHESPSGKLALHYYSDIFAHTKNFASSLLENILRQLETISDLNDAKRLDVLRKNLQWQRTIGAIRL